MTHEHRLHAGTREELEERARKFGHTRSRDGSGGGFTEFWDSRRAAEFAEHELLEHNKAYARLAANMVVKGAKIGKVLTDISARKAVLIEAYGFTEQTETEGATEIDDGWDAATMRGWGEWCAIISLEDILKGER